MLHLIYDVITYDVIIYDVIRNSDLFRSLLVIDGTVTFDLRHEIMSVFYSRNIGGSAKFSFGVKMTNHRGIRQIWGHLKKGKKWVRHISVVNQANLGKSCPILPSGKTG